MTVYNFIKHYRADDDLEVIINDTIETTAFAIQGNDPIIGINAETANAEIRSWNFEAGTLYIEI